MNIDSDRINFPFSPSGVPHQPKCRIPSSGFPLYGSPHKTQPGWKSGAGNWKEGSCCDAETKAPAAISSQCAVLGQADRCTLALSNHPHGPLGGNSSQAHDAIIKSQPHFGFLECFRESHSVFWLWVETRGSSRTYSASGFVLPFGFPESVLVTHVNKPLNQTGG